MTKQKFYSILEAALVATRENLENPAKIVCAKYADALAFCTRHQLPETSPEDKAPGSYTSMMADLLEGAGTNERYNSDKWESYVGGCGALALTPNADAIRDHYFTSEQIEKYNLDWNTYPPRCKDWQTYEARRLHAAADMLCCLADLLGLFNM